METRDVALHRMSLKQWRGTLDGVLTTAFLSLREFLRIAARQRRGNAVLIGSTPACLANPATRIRLPKSAMAFGLTRS